MPKNDNINKVLVIGSGPIIIGQAAEFDYAGTQACRTLKQENIETVLVNSNPATIMTDQDMASQVYLEPLQVDVIQNILLREKCDALLASLGGQTALNLAMELFESGFLAKHKIKLLGTQAAGIKKGEDREEFRNAMLKINVPCIPSGIAHDLAEAIELADDIGYPVIVRPAFTLGGTGGGITANLEELREIAATGLEVSRVHQVLIEKSIAGWKEIEFEVVRDADGYAITVCSMENFDPVGVHTGDSIVMAPALTLKSEEYDMLRNAALRIVEELEIEGGCNVQFALHPANGEYAVIEVNPRLSRSSALASKATGYPIAKVATKIALGYSLHEIRNEFTGKAWAATEPVIDYVVTKIPKWPFDKFVHAKRNLGTQMKATGEIMSIASTTEGSLLKAIRSLEQGFVTLTKPSMRELSDNDLMEVILQVDDRRLFYLAEVMRRGKSIDELYDITQISPYFLNVVKNIVDLESALIKLKEEKHLEKLSFRELHEIPELKQLMIQAAKWSFSETALSNLLGMEYSYIQKIWREIGIRTVYKTIDTGAGESKAESPYYYGCLELAGESGQSDSNVKIKSSAEINSEYNGVSEYDEKSEISVTDETAKKKKIVVLGSGPIRIGQGIEFDYCSVHCVQALKTCGYESIIINNNPETVSTDFDTSDRLYFEPLMIDDVARVLAKENPDGVICQFGGQTAIKLIEDVSNLGYTILGTSADDVDRAEDRARFDQVLENCQVPRPQAASVYTTKEALAAASDLGYPVLLRPSYVLGGQGMMICNNAQAIEEFMAIINLQAQEHPILIDKYLKGTELEVDALSDGTNVLIPGIMEHLEKAGVHSGDSISIFPAYVSDKVKEKIVAYTERLAKELNVKGLINIQFILYNYEVYVLEVNPRSSRTVPYISKVTGLPIVDLATRLMVGSSFEELDLPTGLYANYPAVYAIKAPVFSFEKLHNVDTVLGPEMKSTGEVLGLSEHYADAMYKAILASGFKFPVKGSAILMWVSDTDRAELLPLAERLYDLGFDFYATGGTANYLNRHGLPTSVVKYSDTNGHDVQSFIRSGKVKLFINTARSGETQGLGFTLRRLCIEHGIATLTSLDTLVAVTECLEKDLDVNDLTTYTIAEFAEIVRQTRHFNKPINEMTMDEIKTIRKQSDNIEIEL
ncbi:MAG TPA: carbamoyl-phosphate synthase large subunit [Clostridiaceae bacterium]|nr:carbamoyl-phosphate synthase large subunit [Clostridiaceae bacterium]